MTLMKSALLLKSAAIALALGMGSAHADANLEFIQWWEPELPAGALRGIMDDFEAQGISTSLVAVSGVSIGAINGACIVGSESRADGLKRLERLWSDLAYRTGMPRMFDFSAWGIPLSPARDMSLFGLPGFYQPRFDFWNFWRWISFYDTSPLEKTLRNYIAFERIDQSTTLFSVTAVEVESGKLRRFRNREDPGIREAKKPEGEIPDHPNVCVRPFEPRHVVASGSLAPQLPWTEIKGFRYWDGGLVDNTPLGDAMEAFSTDDKVYRLIVVMNLYPLSAQTPGGLLDVIDRVHELAFGNRARQDRVTTRRINEFLRVIDKLAAIAPGDRINEELASELKKLSLYKIVKTIEVDLQNTQGPQEEEDGEAGLRDFSPETIRARRCRGRKRAFTTITEELAADKFYPTIAAPEIAPAEA